MKVDLTLGARAPRMKPSRLSEDLVLDFGTPSAGQVLSKYQPDEPKVYSRATAGETHLVGDIFAPGTNNPPRQTLIKNPLLDDPYASVGDKRFVALHNINRTDCYAGSEAESDAAFSGGGIRKHNQPQDTPKTYDGNLSEDELTEAMAETIVDLIEAYPGLSVGEIFDAYVVKKENPHLSFGEVLESFAKEFRPERVQRMVAELNDLKQMAKTKIGTSTNLKSSEPKPGQPKQKFDAVSGSAGRAIALASTTAIGKKKNNGITGSVSESVDIFRTGRLPGF
jgi:hypothetical protein